MSVNFAELLDTPIEDAKRPPTLPRGSYHGMIKSFEFDESKEKKTPLVRYQVGLTAATENVDEEALTEIDLSKRQMPYEFYITEDSKYRLREFLEAMGISIAGRKFKEAIGDVVGEAVLVDVEHNPNRKDPAAPPFARIASIGPDKS